MLKTILMVTTALLIMAMSSAFANSGCGTGHGGSGGGSGGSVGGTSPGSTGGGGNAAGTGSTGSSSGVAAGGAGDRHIPSAVIRDSYGRSVATGAVKVFVPVVAAAKQKVRKPKLALTPKAPDPCRCSIAGKG